MLNNNTSTKFLLTVSSLIMLSGCSWKKRIDVVQDNASTDYSEFATSVPDRVHFDLDSAKLSLQAKSDLDKQANWIINHTSGSYIVSGHTDERGTREYNIALGEKRADSVKSYLVSQGANPQIISTISFGKEKPIAFGHDEAAWKQNRRVVTSHKPVSHVDTTSINTPVETTNTKSKIIHKAHKAKNSVKVKAHEVMDKAKSKMNNTKKTSSKIMDNTKDKINHMKEKSHEAVDNMKEKGHETMDNMKEKGHETMDSAKNKMDHMKEKSGEVVDTIKDKTKETVDAVKEKVHDNKDEK